MIEKHPIRDRASWLAMRRGDLTASDIGAVCGVDEYRTALSVFTDKMGQGVINETAIMQRGRWLEAAAAEALIECYPNWDIRNPNLYIRDPQVRLGCTPDRLGEDADEPGIINLQIKTVSRPTFERWDGVPPMSYTLQTACEGMLVDARTSYLAAFVISTFEADLVLFEVPRHAGAEIRIKQTAVDFWHDIELGRVPRPDFRRDSDVIAALYSQQKPGTAIDLSGSNRIREVLETRDKLKETIKAASEEVSALDAEIKYELGECEKATLPGWRVSWKVQTRKAFTVPENTTRVLRVTKETED